MSLNSIVSLILIAFVGSSIFTEANAVEFLSAKNVKLYIKDPSKIPDKKFDPQHPDYPVWVALQALKSDRRDKGRTVIKTLEPLLPEIKYRGLEEVKGSKAKLYAGTIGSYDLWRDLIFLLLGRAYYEDGSDPDAITYLSSIGMDSPFAIVARTELAWSLLRAKKVSKASKTLDELESLKGANPREREEIKLLRAYYLLQNREIKSATKLARSLKFDPNSERLLHALRVKILAQGHLDDYVATSDTAPFAQKKKHLREVIKLCEAVPLTERDADFSFLAGESYWHLASIMRVENFVRYRNEIFSALDKADKWLAPWVKKSLNGKGSELNEEALFFSVAVLWEQNKYEEALPRLRAIPRLFPQGQYRTDVYQLLADYYFDKRKYKKSLVYYGKLAEVAAAGKAAYGIYKSAWAFYNMDEKWKGLRHLERLVMHYRKRFPDEKELPPGSLVIEAKQDMVTMMAELMKYEAAVGELQIFDYQKAQLHDIRERLAANYKRLGRYRDSDGVWRILLKEDPKSERAFFWLKELLLTQYAWGKRQRLAKTIDFYIPKLGSKSSFKTQYKELEDELVKLTLRVHREARKTDDKDIWKAVDSMYGSFMSFFEGSRYGDLWYFGAQRKERIKNRMDAIRWYQQAASIENYKSAKDAALSVLRIAKDLADEASLKKKPNEKVYAQLVEASDWYIANFPETKQRGLAEFILFEAYERTNRFEDARKYFLEIAAREEFDKEHQNQYQNHNAKIYKKKNWQESFLLAKELHAAISSSGRKKDPKFLAKLLKIRQETAFQKAFSLEKKQPDDARKWYTQAISSPNEDPKVRLRAWHNYLLTFKLPKQSEAYLENYNRFLKEYQPPKGLKKAQRKLLVAVHDWAGRAFEESGNPVAKGIALERSAVYEPDPKKRENRQWTAAVLFGSYYQRNRMLKLIDTMVKSDAKIVRSAESRITMARLFFWNEEYTRSWNFVKPMLSRKKVDPTAWLLVRDLFDRTRRAKPPLYAAIKGYLLERRRAIQNTSILEPVWAELVHPTFDVESVARWASGTERNPASILPPIPASQPAHVQLRTKLTGVTKILKELGKQKQSLKRYTGTGVPQVTITAVCAAPKVTGSAVKLLAKLSEKPVKSKQWPAFVSKLKKKMKDLIGVAKKEKTACKRQRQNNMFLPPVKKVAAPLCSEYECFPRKPGSTSDVVGLENDWKGAKVSRLDKVFKMMKIGAWATAEYIAYEAKSIQERSILLGLIRLGIRDTWNAAPLLKAAQKSKTFAPHARLLEARTVFRHGYRSVAAKKLVGIKPNRLLEWEKELFKELVDQIRERKPASSDSSEEESEEEFNFY